MILIILIGDGIYDKLSNEEIISLVWNCKSKYNSPLKIHEYCGIVTDTIMKQSLKKCTVDNISCIFICFENYANKCKELSFKYQCNKRLLTIKMKDGESEIPIGKDGRHDDAGSGSDSEIQSSSKDLSLPPIISSKGSNQNLNNTSHECKQSRDQSQLQSNNINDNNNNKEG